MTCNMNHHVCGTLYKYMISYVSYNGVSLSRRQLVKSLTDRFGDDILVLSGNGVASILVFKSKAAGHLNIVSNDDGDDIDIALR